MDDLNPTGYAQVVEELNTGVVQRIYTYGLQRISQNQIIGNAWTVSFYGYDGGGTVRLLTDSAGTVTDTYDYDAWGNAVNVTGSTPNVYLYRGEQYDPDLGLYYLWARYFNPLTGRFLARDAESGCTRLPATLHKYAYASADPVNRIDPSGREDDVDYTELLKYIAVGVLFTAAYVESRTHAVGQLIYAAWEGAEKNLKCTAGYVVCGDEVPGGGRRHSGNVWGTSHCKTCLDKCLADGAWPDSVPYMGGNRSCGPGPSN